MLPMQSTGKFATGSAGIDLSGDYDGRVHSRGSKKQLLGDNPSADMVKLDVE